MVESKEVVEGLDREGSQKMKVRDKREFSHIYINNDVDLMSKYKSCLVVMLYIHM